jgi:type II secretory pathway component PulK
MRPLGQRDDGFALVMAVLTLGVLGLIATGFLASLRVHLVETSVYASRAEAEALADAAVNIAVLDLVAARADRRRPRRFAVDGTVTTCRIGEATVEISVQDESARIDLNAAGEPLLTALLVAAGAEPPMADRLTQAILDWRDADSEKRPEGAEAETYRAAGRPHGPKNAQFDSVEELAQVIGMDAPLISRLAPYVTVHSGLAGLDPGVADPTLLENLLAGARRIEAGSSDPADLRARFRRQFPQFVAVSSQQRFAIRATTRLAAATFVREAIVEVVSERARVAYAFRSWRQGTALAPRPRAVDPPPGC